MKKAIYLSTGSLLEILYTEDIYVYKSWIETEKGNKFSVKGHVTSAIRCVGKKVAAFSAV